jgi:hypothetical protein
VDGYVARIHEAFQMADRMLSSTVEQFKLTLHKRLRQRRSALFSSH